jgi:hypothetical protein
VLPTFVYCDPAHHGISWFAGYLDRHQVFLRRLPVFNLIYATPGHWKFERASQVFTTIFRNANLPDPEHLTRYFQIRRLWETRLHALLTRADRDHLRAGDKLYKGEPFESAYQKWFAAGLSEVDLGTLFGPSFLRQEIGFRTHLLPDRHDFLCCQKLHVPLDLRSKTLGPLSVLLHGLGRQRCKLLQRQNSQAETTNNSDAGKSTPWPGATPFCPRFSGPKRPPGFRVAPRHSVSTPASSVRLAGLPSTINGNVLPELS